MTLFVTRNFLEDMALILGEPQRAERHADRPALEAVEIPDLKRALAKAAIPADAA